MMSLKNKRAITPVSSRKTPESVGRCCLSIVKTGHGYQLSCLRVHHLLRDSRKKLSMRNNSFLPTQSLTFILTEKQLD